MYRQAVGWMLFALLTSSLTIHTFAYPNQHEFVPARTPQLPSERIERKFAEKPNAIKKVSLDNLSDLETNSIEDSSSSQNGFSWSNLLGVIMHMLFTPGTPTGPNKSESLDDSVAPSPWANLLSVGLKILTAFLGGGPVGGDGIDKVDNGSSPLQEILAAILPSFLGTSDREQVNTIAKQAGEFLNIIMNLLEALKTSFSHRSIAARSVGRKDSISDAAVAGISLMKGYVRSLGTSEESCMQKYVCDANRECSSDVGQTSIFCHLGTYAVSFVMERSTGSSFDVLYEAGRRGRSGDNCQQAFLECNEV
ncbi:hypothetical protein PPYR_07951 [Photinus pyralis]|uniref:Uncharacterized protein n=2 Tax=Photinus pyralis TaxID=7054 RepID=A0A5N4ARW6_PHOPY|nr:uncharacterized protein LOC116167977 isoform X1 [Photinus pyralis]XP_031341978.1 uncharacterized protein LOC116169911 isoform X1 [Photinus pyralis]KAB0799120.1 hypothetical protein PPYR_07000 [Photinus pyralis]KAB0800071.1 hypothetical protein PPYR_07951 [Photinus pyralis]